MNKRIKRLVTSLSAGLAMTLWACSSMGTAEDQTAAGGLWETMNGYRTWGTFPGFEGMVPGGRSHGAKYIRIYGNSVALGNLDDPQPGSIIIKEAYKSQDEGTLKDLTVMQRVAGYNAEGGDWFWAKYSPEGDLQASGAVGMCINCHSDAGGDDFLYVNDE